MIVVILAVAYKTYLLARAPSDADPAKPSAAPAEPINAGTATWLKAFIAGQAVEHETYGKGKITTLSHLRGQDYRMTVQFESGEKITFQAPYTGLRKL
jgi:hypothetical protein